MHKTLRMLGFFFWSVLTVDILIEILDWFGRWDLLSSFMANHPQIASLFRSPFIYAALLVLGFVFLRAERHLKIPRIRARFVNSRTIPNLSTTKMQVVFDSENKKPGWDEQRIDWHWFIEVQLANESETPVTIEDIQICVKAGPKWHKRPVPATVSNGLQNFMMDMALDGSGKSNKKKCEEPRYRPVPGLMDIIRAVPLTIGIGYRGWILVELPSVSQKDVYGGHLDIDVWLIDALQGKHALEFKRKSDKQWDTSFYIIDK